MKLVVFMLFFANIALAGNGGSSMHSHGMQGGCTDVRTINHRPVQFNIPMHSNAPTPIFVDGGHVRLEPKPEPVKPVGPTESERKANELRELYTTLSQTSERPSDAIIETFVTNTTQILIRFSEHNPIAKRRWSSESRLAFKILYGSICYIGNPGDSEIRDWLSRDAGLTQQDFADLDSIRQNTGVHRSAAMASFALHGGIGVDFSHHNPMRSVVRRFIERF